jgi:hypothetical protein
MSFLSEFRENREPRIGLTGLPIRKGQQQRQRNGVLGTSDTLEEWIAKPV